ncbi:hypothetical protein QGP82_05325 [Leptothoe sp. LEGE 181152]|nr:hypothetical protein [Leptothoe sp. LEGE 181152]
MANFDYDVLDGNETALKIRGEDLGLDGIVQIVGQKFYSDALGVVGDAAAADETVDASAISILKALLRESRTTEFDSGVVSVGASPTEIVIVDVSNSRTMGIQIENTGATALNTFVCSARYHSDLGGFFNPFAQSAADYDTNAGRQTGNTLNPVIASSAIGFPAGDPRTLAGGASAWLELNVARYQSVRFAASTASGSTDVRLRGVVK